MADLHFVDFVARRGKKSNSGYLTTFPTISLLCSLTDEPYLRSVFPRFFAFSHHGQAAVRKIFFHDHAPKQEISTFPLSKVEIVAY